MKPILITVKSVLRGVGQVMLQRNAATGVLFLIGIAVNSITMAFAALLGALLGTLLARLFNFPNDEIEDGLYGFNPALVAIAAVLIWSITVTGISIAIVGVVLATFIMRVMQKYRLSPYTFPFIATIWLAILLMPELQTISSNKPHTSITAVDGFFQGIGQVMFQANTLTGLIFLIAIAVNNFKSTALAALGTSLGLVAALLLMWPLEQLATGLYGYNAVLAAISIPLVSQRLWLLIAGILLSIIFMHVMLMWQLPALTFPFVLATWLCVLAERFYLRVKPVHPI